MAYSLLLFFLFSLVFLYSVSPAVCESIPTQWSIRVQNDDAPFGGRSQQGVEALPSGSLIVLGTGPSGELSNDCWKSTNDGQSWTRVGSAPWAPRRGHRTLLMDNDLWMFGGYNATSNTYFNDVWMTKDECNTWQKIGGSYPGVEGACTANIFGVALSTTGKFSSNNAPTSNSYISDDGSTWTLVADERVNGRQYRMWRLPGQTRFNAACTRLGSLVIVAGGTNSTGHQLSDIWAFDPSMEMWYKIRDLPVSRSGGIIIGKLPKLFLIGGKDLTDNKYKDDVWEWTLSSIENPANQSPWIKSFDSLAFGGLTSAAAVYNSVSQKLIVVGGMNQAGPSSKVYQLSFEDVPQCAGLTINNYE